MIKSSIELPIIIYKDIILEVYPETESIYTEYFNESCSVCSRGKLITQFWNMIKELDKTNRDFTKFADFPNVLKKRLMGEESDITPEQKMHQIIESQPPDLTSCINYLSQASVVVNDMLEGNTTNEQRWQVIGYLGEAANKIVSYNADQARQIKMMRHDFVENNASSTLYQSIINKLNELSGPE